MSNEKISDLTAGTPPYDPATLLELSVPNGSGGWNSRKGQLSDISGPVIKSISASLTSAQIKALHTSPIVFLAGVSGKTIIPVAATIQYTFVSADYTLPGGAGVFYNSTGNIIDADNNGSSAMIDFTDISSGLGASFFLPVAVAKQPAVGLANPQNINLVIYCESGDPTVGDSTLVVTLWYFLI